MAEDQKMPEDAIEIVFDDVLWSLLESSQQNGLTAEEVQTVWKAVKGFCYHENFDKFYDKEQKKTKEQLKTIYARAFNVQRYLAEADQDQG